MGLVPERARHPSVARHADLNQRSSGHENAPEIAPRGVRLSLFAEQAFEQTVEPSSTQGWSTRTMVGFGRPAEPP